MKTKLDKETLQLILSELLTLCEEVNKNKIEKKLKLLNKKEDKLNIEISKKEKILNESNTIKKPYIEKINNLKILNENKRIELLRLLGENDE